jgi:site-specific recombinase XerD
MNSLFDSKEIWRTDPAKAFDAFLQSAEFQELGLRRPSRSVTGEPPPPPNPLRASSIRVYASMFAKYLRWLAARQLPLFDVSSADLLAFLERGKTIDGVIVQELNSRIKHKYLRLLERVYIHLALQPNPAQHASFDIFKSGDKARIGRDAGVATLTEAQQIEFLRALPQPSAPTNQHDASHGWKRRRDRALMAMMLGAGLKVSEVIGIYSENIGEKDSTGSIPITISPGSAGGTIRWHQTQLRPFAVPEVVRWLLERSDLKIPGPLLFPATLEGGRLNKATVYRQVKATFERAGIEVPRLGGRTLRNSFAARELKAGESIELVGEFMGHRKRRSTEYYLPMPPHGVPK